MTAESLIEFLLQGMEQVGPSKIAVASDGASLTYEDLVSGARGIASTLRGSGIGRGDRVGIWMDKTPVCVQSLFGVMWSGAAYVPLDPRAPWRRCKKILDDCELSALMVDEARVRFLPSLLQGAELRLLVVDFADQSAVQDVIGSRRYESIEQALVAPAEECQLPAAEDLAYILYTSGSTGTPKGVVHTHQSGLAFARWAKETFGTVADDVFSSHAPFHFDLSILDLYTALGSGGTVQLISTTEAMLAPYLVKKVAEWNITIWYSVPSILISMLDVGKLEELGFGKVRVLLFAGEVFPTPQLRRLRAALPKVQLANLFGPTETNVCTYYEVRAKIPETLTAPIPIGRTCEHMETFVLDDGGKEAGIDAIGTLWAKGDNLMQGYWNDPVRSDSVLQPDPRNLPGKAYCTGDRVRLQSDGNYEFLGRKDHMIKIRGYRVDLGDVESAIASHASVLEAVALAISDGGAGSKLVASAVLRRGESVEAKALRAHCAEHLPTYMIPESVEIREVLPRTSTGKVDRQALHEAWTQEMRRIHES